MLTLIGTSICDVQEKFRTAIWEFPKVYVRPATRLTLYACPLPSYSPTGPTYSISTSAKMVKAGTNSPRSQEAAHTGVPFLRPDLTVIGHSKNPQHTHLLHDAERSPPGRDRPRNHIAPAHRSLRNHRG